MFRRLLMFSCVSLLSACATSPTHYEFSRSRVVPDSKDVVWERVVEFFAANNLAIKTIEKDSGIVAAERLFPGAPTTKGMILDWASCGHAPLETPIRQSVDLNVFVRPQAGGTNVTVNTQFQEVRNFLDETGTYECNSTGRLENMILDVAEGR